MQTMQGSATSGSPTDAGSAAATAPCVRGDIAREDADSAVGVCVCVCVCV
jgi:hypothetical protein